MSFPPEPSVLRETVPVRVDYQVYPSGDATGLVARRTASSDQEHAQEHIVSEGTPFFHIDLIAAVRSAERLGLEEEEEGSESGESGPSGSSRVDILIDLHN